MDRDGRYYAFADPGYAFDHVYNSIISNNIVFPLRVHRGDNCLSFSNYVDGDASNFGDNPIKIDADKADVFERDMGVTPNSSFHFKDEYKDYEDIVGIYAGTGFSDEKSLAPIPRIISKTVDEQTDGFGKLKIEVTIKAK